MKMTKMMKRILACAAVMAMIFSLTACGGSQAQTAAEPAAAEEQKEAETPADAAEPETKPEETAQETETVAEDTASETETEAAPSEEAGRRQRLRRLLRQRIRMF